MIEKDIEILKRAKFYVENLANGINPLDGSSLPEEDIVNNVKVSRCLFYISSVLQQNIDELFNGHKISSKPSLEFKISAEQLKNFVYSSEPIGVAKIVRQVNSFIDTNSMKKLAAGTVTFWLEYQGYLTKVPYRNGKKSIETEKGKLLGITSEERTNLNGITFWAVLYNINAQKFIINNLPYLAQSKVIETQYFSK